MFAPVRYTWLVAVRSSLGARYLAGGLAIGVFWCCIPIFILHWPCALATAYVFRCSRLGATAGVFLSNPLTIPPQYSLAWILGHVATPLGVSTPVPLFVEDSSLREVIMSLGWGDFAAMLVGGAILGSVLAVPVYFVALRSLQNRSQRGGAAREVGTPGADRDGD